MNLPWLDNFYTLEKDEDGSLKKYTDNDEDPAMDLQAIMSKDSWKMTNSSSMKREMMNRVRSSSWDGGIEEKKLLNNDTKISRW